MDGRIDVVIQTADTVFTVFLSLLLLFSIYYNGSTIAGSSIPCSSIYYIEALPIQLNYDLIQVLGGIYFLRVVVYGRSYVLVSIVVVLCSAAVNALFFSPSFPSIHLSYIDTK